MGQGVVLGRAVSSLRSVETHPSTLDSSVFFCRFFFKLPSAPRGRGGIAGAAGARAGASRKGCAGVRSSRRSGFRSREVLAPSRAAPSGCARCALPRIALTPAPGNPDRSRDQRAERGCPRSGRKMVDDLGAAAGGPRVRLALPRKSRLLVSLTRTTRKILPLPVLRAGFAAFPETGGWPLLVLSDSSLGQPTRRQTGCPGSLAGARAAGERSPAETDGRSSAALQRADTRFANTDQGVRAEARMDSGLPLDSGAFGLWCSPADVAARSSAEGIASKVFVASCDMTMYARRSRGHRKNGEE